MRDLFYASRFKKDLKALYKGRSAKDVEELKADIGKVISLLQADKPLPEKNVDHPLTGEWKSFRDCHVRPDLVLIYQKQGEDELHLARIGSHSDLF